jgi:hypothetical protein
MKILVKVMVTALLTAVIVLPAGCASSTKTTPGHQNNRWLEMLRLIPEIKEPIADNLDIRGRSISRTTLTWLRNKQSILRCPKYLKKCS